MDYKATLDWMFAQLPMYQAIGAADLQKRLDQYRTTCKLSRKS